MGSEMIRTSTQIAGMYYVFYIQKKICLIELLLKYIAVHNKYIIFIKLCFVSQNFPS